MIQFCNDARSPPSFPLSGPCGRRRLGDCKTKSKTCQTDNQLQYAHEHRGVDVWYGSRVHFFRLFLIVPLMCRKGVPTEWSARQEWSLASTPSFAT